MKMALCKGDSCDKSQYVFFCIVTPLNPDQAKINLFIVRFESSPRTVSNLRVHSLNYIVRS